MRNTIQDLNNHLFAQMERLSDEGLIGDALEAELSRARGVVSVSAQIITNADLMLRASKVRSEGLMVGKLPTALGVDK